MEPKNHQSEDLIGAAEGTQHWYAFDPMARLRAAMSGTDSEKKPDFPETRGFQGIYGWHQASASDEALVWGDGSYLYRLDRDWNLQSREIGWTDYIVQTKDAILVLASEYGEYDTRWVLKTYDKHLSLLSEKVLLETPKTFFSSGFMTQFDLFVLLNDPDFRLMSDPSAPTDTSLYHIDLSTGETREWHWESLEWEGLEVGPCSIYAANAGKPYLHGSLYTGKDGDRREIILIFDPQTGSFSSIWRESDYCGEGQFIFFDWERNIMWTRPTEAERKNRRGLPKYSLVARKIAPNAPILPDMPVWKKAPGHNVRYSSFSYFDGQHAYYTPTKRTFFGYDESGTRSSNWKEGKDGQLDISIFWPQAGKIVMSSTREGEYIIYPMSVEKPDDRELITPRQID